MRLGSRIRTVAPAFPSVGPAYLAGTLSGAVLTPRRVGRDRVIRGWLGPQLVDVPQGVMLLNDPYSRPRDSGPYTPAGIPGGEGASSPIPTVTPTAAPAPCNCGCG